jgi:hypothetical protein
LKIGPGSTGFLFTFDAGVLGSLPTHAGVVWTDGAGQITFEAFGPGGVSLGTIGPVSDPGVFPDGGITGETAEDRFFGVTAAGGISAIFISNSAGGIEVDHLQYGLLIAGPAAVPEPASLLLLGVGGLGAAGWARRRKMARA